MNFDKELISLLCKKSLTISNRQIFSILDTKKLNELLLKIEKNEEFYNYISKLNKKEESLVYNQDTDLTKIFKYSLIEAYLDFDISGIDKKELLERIDYLKLLLIEGNVDIDNTSFDGMSLLMLAVKTFSDEIVKIITGVKRQPLTLAEGNFLLNIIRGSINFYTDQRESVLLCLEEISVLIFEKGFFISDVSLQDKANLLTDQYLELALSEKIKLPNYRGINIKLLLIQACQGNKKSASQLMRKSDFFIQPIDQNSNVLADYITKYYKDDDSIKEEVKDLFELLMFRINVIEPDKYSKQDQIMSFYKKCDLLLKCSVKNKFKINLSFLSKKDLLPNYSSEEKFFKDLSPLQRKFSNHQGALISLINICQENEIEEKEISFLRKMWIEECNNSCFPFFVLMFIKYSSLYVVKKFVDNWTHLPIDIFLELMVLSNREDLIHHFIDKAEKIPSHSFRIACYLNNSNIVQYFISLSPRFTNTNMYSIIDAYCGKDQDLFSYICNHYVNNKIFSEDERIEQGQKIIKLICDHYEVTCLDEQNDNGETPLNFAIKSINNKGKEKISLHLAQYLIELGADIHMKGIDNKSPFELIMESKNHKLIETMSKKQNLFLNAVKHLHVRIAWNLLVQYFDDIFKSIAGLWPVNQINEQNNLPKIDEQYFFKPACTPLDSFDIKYRDIKISK